MQEKIKDYGMSNSIEITKMKIVLLAIWDKQNHPEATKYINDFRNEISELNIYWQTILEKVEKDDSKHQNQGNE